VSTAFKDLIDALVVLSKYADDDLVSPLHCEHDTLTVMVEAERVPDAIKYALGVMGFDPDENGYFRSYRFGSA